MSRLRGSTFAEYTRQASGKVLRGRTMRVRKAQASGRSMRYLLSVDRSLGRVSLKKISASVKNANNRVRARSAKKNAARGTTRSQNPSVPNGGRSVRVV